MARSELTELLNSPTKGVDRTANTPNGTIAKLFRLMMSDTNVGLAEWGALMRDYVSDPVNGIPSNRRDQTSARGNLTAAFIKDSMTFKVFAKALRFFKVRKIDIAIRAYHLDGKITLHSTEMPIYAMPHTDEHDDDDDDFEPRRRYDPNQTEFDFGKEDDDE
jgi:hypothetical protein